MTKHMDVRRTGRAIAAIQLPDGGIPWGRGRHIDPWNHVEAAMGLDVAGEHASARRAYRWLAATQRPDGAWPAATLNGEVFDPTLDANMVAYIATGVWHHLRYTDETAFLEEMWPTIVRAVGFVLDLQSPEGHIYWARDGHGRIWPGALVTSSACIYLSLRCAADLAAVVGIELPDVELSLGALRSAVERSPELFERKDRYSMDWYYPVLGGAIEGEEGRERLRRGWERFVVSDEGCLCVAERQWVTTGETCELVLACLSVGLEEEAHALFEWIQSLRARDGLYWTGMNLPDRVTWPNERATWSAGAALLAWEALHLDGPTRELFGARRRSAVPQTHPGAGPARRR